MGFLPNKIDPTSSEGAAHPVIVFSHETQHMLDLRCVCATLTPKEDNYQKD